MTVRKSLGTKMLFHLFSKRLIKYFTMFLLCISLAIPLLISNYSIAREERLQEAQRQLQNGLNILETQIQKAGELVNVILEEHDLMQLMLVEGAPPPEQYPVIRTMQKRLINLSMMQEGFESSYLLFKYNPIMISEKYSSDYRVAFHQIYPNAQITAEEWHQAHFKEPFFAGQYEGMELLAGKNSENFVYLLNVSQYPGVYSVCVLGCIFSRDTLIKNMLPAERIEDSFLVLSSNTEDFLRHNAEKQGQKDYIVVHAYSEPLGFHVVEGIPTSVLSQTVFTMLMWTIVWFFVGSLLVFVCALLFTLLETRNMGSIVSVAYHSNLALETENNEYLYVRSAIQHINAVNQERLRRIQMLSGSLKASLLENMLLMGIYTENDEQEMLSYFPKGFHHYSVALLSFHIPDDFSYPRSQQSADIETLFASSCPYSYESVAVGTQEFAFVIYHSEKANISSMLLEILSMSRSGELPPLHIGLSQPAKGIQCLHSAFLQAKHALFLCRKQVDGLYLYDIPERDISKAEIDIGMLLKLSDILLSGNGDTASQMIQKIWTSAGQNPYEQQSVFILLRQILCKAYQKLSIGKDVDDREFIPIFEEIGQMNSPVKLLLDGAGSICSAVRNNRKSNNEQLRNNILEMIEHGYADPNLSAGSIADKLEISEKYVYNFIKEHTGKSLGKVIEDVRIAKASQLLSETELSGKVISEQVGFGSVNTFYRAFSRKYGISPTQWREKQHSPGDK